MLQRLGSSLVKHKSKILGAIERILSNKLDEHVSVKDFGAVGDWDAVRQTGTNDTEAFNKAMAHLKRVGGGSLFIPSGNYLVKNVEVPDNVLIWGEGETSVLYQVEEPWAGSVACLVTNLDRSVSRPDWTKNTKNITIRDIKFKRQNRTTYKSSGDPQQWMHLLDINASSHVKVLDCHFEGFNGDAIYLAGGSGNNEGHNLDIEISGNYFIGVDNQNRNAISVIDCEGLLISGNTFRACTCQYQPAPIDIEPNAFTFHRIRDIKIVNNRFVHGGGMAAGISVVFPDVAYTTRPMGILIEGNEIDSGSTTSTACGILIRPFGTPNMDKENMIRIAHNKIVRCLRAFDMHTAVGVLIESNTIREMRGGDLVGFGGDQAALKKCLNITYRNNDYRNVGQDGGTSSAINIYDIDSLYLEGNVFRNIGKAGEGTGVIFKAGRTGRNIHVKDNHFINEGRMAHAISWDGYAFDASTNTQDGNRYTGITGKRNIPALYGDQAKASWVPEVYLDSGTTTYSSRTGTYRIVGDMVHFEMEAVITGFSEASNINIKLPTKAEVDSKFIVPVMMSGGLVSQTGLNFGSFSGNSDKATLRIYKSGLYTNVASLTSGSATTVRASGSYRLQP